MKGNYNHQQPADYYGNAPVRTKCEFLLEGFLREAKIPYLINQVFCFECDRFYTYESMDMPKRCHYCSVNFIKENIYGERGHLSRPDFLLDYDGKKKLGIIRVDGKVHDKIKATRIRDYHILNSFKERGIKIFIVKNEMLLKRTVKEIREFVIDIDEMMKDDSLYSKYEKSKGFKELVYCPDINVRRYNR